jgi:NADH:ubiquinone reductase (H+-translocating)
MSAMKEIDAAPVPARAAAEAVTAPASRPRVVIVGAGFGGLSAAAGLARAPVEVTVVDERNYHLFQPLLYQVATAGLAPTDIAEPIRAILSRQKNARVLMGRVVGVDTAKRTVLLRDQALPYDTLIIATGARHAYFGHDEWAGVAPGLKTIEDATRLRRNILIAFERAETATDAEEQHRLMTFLVIGGGPTGVEMAGAIAELAKMALAADFRAIDPAMSRITLIEAGPRVLPAFPEKLSAFAKRALEKLGVEVRLGQAVTGCDAEGVTVGGARIESSTIIWAAGVAASPAAEWLGAAHDRAGRVKVGGDLSVPGHPEIFIIGDTAQVLDSAGQPLPGVAPVAKQQGNYIARLIAARLRNGPVLPPFHYRNLGNLATVGRSAAVVDMGFLRLHGHLAWFFWSFAHIYFLIGFRNRFTVAFDWAWAYVTFQRGARLITGIDDP